MSQHHRARVERQQAAGPLPGTAGQIARILRNTLAADDLYGPAGSAAYHDLTASDTSEVRDVLALLRGVQGPVLELACGAGRLTLPLLAAGHHVTGVDASPSLLGLLSRRLSEPPAARLAARLTLVEADMCTVDLSHRFSAALLGTTTIGLVPPERRRRFFDNIHRHLQSDGLFILSVYTPAPTGHGGGQTHGDTVQALFTEQAVHLLIEHKLSATEQRQVSILRLSDDGPPRLFTSRVHTPSEQTVRSELTDSGFQIQSVEPVRPTAASASSAVLILARRAG
ncbi:daptide-type RiPP biosynthesis methyltransferase [Streptomyces chrestomyceticus]|uniref:daptide-type RiPP biosynthesis methyltransferase n=1 Tax=Streptomyces chrestomyceticus TaxID=68185 RepID=UPI0035A9597E